MCTKNVQNKKHQKTNMSPAPSTGMLHDVGRGASKGIRYSSLNVKHGPSAWKAPL